MRYLSHYRDQLFLLFSIVVVFAVFSNIMSDILKTKASASSDSTQAAQETDKNPLKDFKSLDNYLAYSMPTSWTKVDQVDKESGNSTLLAITSPDFESPEPMVINRGIRININRSYDPNSEETVKKKLNAQYQIYDYNIRAMTLDGRKAMSMHEDYEGHNRFVFIASGDHLWQIAISAKSLEEEQQYDNEINSFLNSIKFKN